MFGIAFPGKPQVIGSFQSSIGQTGNWSFSGVNTGVARSDRYIIVFLSASSTHVCSSSSFVPNVGSISGGTLISSVNFSNAQIQVWAYPAPTGTSANIAFDPGSTGTLILSAYSLFNAGSPLVGAGHFTNTNSNLSTTVTANSGSYVIGGIYGSTASSSWTGLNKDADQNIGGVTFSIASLQSAAALSALAVTGTGSGVAVGTVAWWSP